MKNSEMVDGVEVVNFCDVLDEVLPDWLRNYSATSYAEKSQKVQAWADKNGAIVYSRDREDFSKYEASRLAREAGKTRVVVEDLS